MIPLVAQFSPARLLGGLLAIFSIVANGGCESTPSVAERPTWTDVAPILRGQCGGCHGWTAKETGKSYRLDFYDMSPDICGDAALALDGNLVLAGTALSAAQIKADIVPQAGARWPRMPPQPAPTLADWERQTLERWTAQPTKGPPSPDNRAPTISVSQFPASANKDLSFTAIIDDPDGDSLVGVIEVGNLAFLMNRPGAFTVHFDAASWPAGPVRVGAVLCDGWTRVDSDLGPVQIQH